MYTVNVCPTVRHLNNSTGNDFCCETQKQNDWDNPIFSIENEKEQENDISTFSDAELSTINLLRGTSRIYGSF